LKIKLFLIASLILLMLGVSSAGCATAQDFDKRLSTIVKPYGFSTVLWESKTIPHEMNQLVSSQWEKIDDEIYTVTEYFSAAEQIKILKSQIQAINNNNGQGDLATLEAELHTLQERKLALANATERILEKQIKTALAEHDIYNPLDNYIGLKINLPPLNFRLEKPPHLLVVSPRDRIDSIREVTLNQNISLEEMEAIEDEVDKLGVSSVVVELGGLAALYPSFVTNKASLQFTIDAATEEWVHQYLFFKPLGILYTLDLTGVSRNYEIATMNETVASMVSKEIGNTVCQKYYPQYESSNNQSQADESGFDFNQEMRDIRRAVDEYLAQGEIEQAEEFMEQKRQYLASNGYHIRKLNQAYFAFHGTYADSPTSISPIGVELKQLREQSSSLKDFLNKVTVMTNRQDLIDSLK